MIMEIPRHWDEYEKYKNAFYAGQRVVAVNAMDGSKFKNGTEYTVASFVWKPSSNPIAKGKFFWYIGIVGHADGGAYFLPAIFAPIEQSFKEISFVKIIELEKPLTCAN